MNQLIHPQRFGLFTLMYDCESPEGEMLQDYAEKEWKGLAHKGETPVQIIREVREHATNAKAAIQLASQHIRLSKDEFKRLENDVNCHVEMAGHYACKAEAALFVLRFQYSHQFQDLKQALNLLEQSMEHYRKLEKLTAGSYLYANSMQTQQRKIPLRGVNATYKHWTEVGVALEKELQFYKDKIYKAEQLGAWSAVKRNSLAKANLQMESPLQVVRLDTAVSLFSDTSVMVVALAPELRGLEAYAVPFKEQLKSGTSLSFIADEPGKLLVGYFTGPVSYGLKAPELETNAQANNRGQSEIKIGHALRLRGMPTVNIHSYSFEAGRNSLQLGKGACILIGFVKDAELEKGYDAGEGELDEWFDF